MLTIHRSKGLEFPIVYLPFLWEPGYIPREAQPVLFHDPAGRRRAHDRRRLEGPEFIAPPSTSTDEQRGEDLRLAYVALTRARHQAVVWWAGTWASRDSPLGAAAVRPRRGRRRRAQHGVRPRPTPSAAERFEELAARAPGRVTVERGGSTRLRPPTTAGPVPLATELTAAELRPQPRSALAAHLVHRHHRRAHERCVASEPEQDVGVTDEPAEPGAETPTGSPGPDADTALRRVPCRWPRWRCGAAVGTSCTGVLEASDFAAADLDAELPVTCGDRGPGARSSSATEAAVVTGLRAAIETPLGPLLDGRRLRDVDRADRLDELDLRAAAGRRRTPRGWLDARAASADLLREHLAPGDPLRTYAERLAEPALRTAGPRLPHRQPRPRRPCQRTGRVRASP